MMRKKVLITIFVSVMLMLSAAAAFGATLAKPTITVTAKGVSSVSVSWKNVEGASGYEVYRKTGETGTYKIIRTLDYANKQEYRYINTAVKAGNTYVYKVRAVQDRGTVQTKGGFSSEKQVTLIDDSVPSLTVYLPTTMDKTKKTMIISLTNKSPKDNMYFDGNFALENLASDNQQVYQVKHVSYEKPDLKKTGKLKGTQRLVLRPGEKVRFTCSVSGTFEYNRKNVRLTTCLRYQQKDFVSEYTIADKNKMMTPQEYYEHLTGTTQTEGAK